MKKTVITLASAFVCVFIWIHPAFSSTTIRVGIYQNEPLIVLKSPGRPQGVFIDILEHIAKQESWTIRYVTGSWSGCLDNLNQGNIDLLPGIGFSEEREKQYDFNRESVIENWGQIYFHDESQIKSFLDLSGKKTAVLKNDLYYIYFRSIEEKFEIYPVYVEVESYHDILKLLDEKVVSVGIIPRLYGSYQEKNFNLIKSTMNFKPTTLHFAGLKNKKKDILDTIDNHLTTMKKNRNSVFYRSRNLWIEGVRKVVFPGWLRPFWVFVFIVSFILFIIIANFLLRRLVRLRTEQLKTSIAEQEKIVSELKIAHDIQMELLPSTFPPFPDRPEIDLYARIEPAKEVGGDFYDFFFIDQDKLCLVIGDVSGKGVPAALFMSMAKTNIKATAKILKEPQMILESVNSEISRNNESCTFVTVFLAMLNLKTGHLIYTNAGHNLPVFVTPGNQPEFLSGAECAAIGFDEDNTFSSKSISLQKGDSIYLYTDGITEAVNPHKESYSEEALLHSIVKNISGSPANASKAILDDVNAFAGSMRGFDDITLLILKYMGEGTDV